MTYLDLEDLIVARLRDRVPAVPPEQVLTLPDLAHIDERAQITPALHVVFSGEAADRPPSGAISQLITQHWTIIVAVRNSTDVLTGAAARAEAAPLVTAVHAALLGWTPHTEAEAFWRAPTPPPGYRQGFAYYPQTFATQVSIRGAR